MNDTKTIAILKSLADTTRLSIVRKLAREGCEVASHAIVQDCSESLKLSQPTMSHHFARLVQAGVLSERKSGTEKHYQLNKEHLLARGIDIDKL